MAGKGNRDDQFPQLHESKEPGKARKGKVNLRKSLAWDSAFFTDAGSILPVKGLYLCNPLL